MTVNKFPVLYTASGACDTLTIRPVK